MSVTWPCSGQSADILVVVVVDRQMAAAGGGGDDDDQFFEPPRTPHLVLKDNGAMQVGERRAGKFST